MALVSITAEVSEHIEMYIFCCVIYIIAVFIELLSGMKLFESINSFNEYNNPMSRN